MKRIIIIIFAITILQGCAAPVGSIAKRDDGTYLLYKEDRAGMFGSFDGLKKNVNQEVEEFARKEGKRVVIISEKGRPGSLAYADWSRYSVVFALKDPAEEAKVDQQKGAYSSCINELEKDPSLSIIKAKIPFGMVRNQSFMMLANQNKPNEEERLAIASYGDKVKRCDEMYDRWLKLANAPTDFSALVHNANSARDKILVDLYNRNISYGDYAKAIQDMNGNFDAALAQLDKENNRESADAKARQEMIANQSAIAEAQLSQANAANRAASAAIIQATKPVYTAPPRVISPPTSSRSLNCTSTNSFGTVNTTCY